jgi:hypothetical protein
MKRVWYAALTIAVAGCYPGQISTVEELDVAVTFRNPEANYAQLLTYAIPDTVVQIDEDSSAIEIDHQYDQQIVDKVKARLDAYGYQLLSWDTAGINVDTPDVFVFVSAAADRYTSYSYFPGYWWGYWGWYYPPCFYCYPGYPGYITQTTYEAGTLFIDMIETGSYNPADSTIVFPWSGAFNGLLQTGTNLTRVRNGIDQMFDDSPYLAEGKTGGTN